MEMATDETSSWDEYDSDTGLDEDENEFDSCSRCEGFGHARGCYECGLISKGRESSPEEKRAFGAACKILGDHLIVLGIEDDKDVAWNHAKAWIRAMDTRGANPEEGSRRASEWLEAGWTDLSVIEDHIRYHADGPAEAVAILTAMGMSEADIGLTKSGDYNETGFANAHNESLLEELEMHSRGRR